MLSLARQTSWMTLSFIALTSHQFQGSADLRTSVTLDRTNTTNDWFRFGIVNMPAIPSEQVIDAVIRRNGNMQSIASRNTGDRMFVY